jgi:hypothetical protein
MPRPFRHGVFTPWEFLVQAKRLANGSLPILLSMLVIVRLLFSGIEILSRM